MRRRLSTLTAVVSTLLLLLAVPASAAEEAESHGVSVAGSFEGLALAAVLGILVGIAIFASLQGGPADPDDDHHH